MRIVYIDFIRFPTEKAHGYQIAKTAEFLSESSEVKLVFPNRINDINTIPKDYFDLNNKLDVEYINIFDPFKYFHFLDGLLLTLLLYLWRTLFIAIIYFKYSDQKNDIILFSRSFFAGILGFLGFNIYLEEHDPPITKIKSLIYSFFLKGFKGIVAISHGVANQLEGMTTLPVTIIPDATDIPDIHLSKKSIREKYSIPLSAFVAGYTGSLIPSWKGVKTVIECSKMMPKCIFLIAGGKESDMLDICNPLPENVIYLERLSRKEIRLIQSCCDVLLLPNLKNNKNSEFFTSPLKLFEYFSVKVPVIASNIQSIRQISKDGVSYFEAGNSHGLLKAIDNIKENKNIPNVEFAYKIALENTWENRAAKIIDFLKGGINV